MTGYEPAEQPAPGERLVKLNTTETPFPPSPRVITAIRDIEPEPLRVYPPPAAQQFCETAGALHGVAAQNIIAGNGSDEILGIVLRTFVGAGARVASPWPTYPSFTALCEIQGAEHAQAPWLEAWRLPAAQLLALRPAAIYLASPNDPSGTAVSPSEVAELAGRFKGPLIVDEAFADFADANCISLLAENENLIITRSLSKGYALAGLRFGYAIAHEQVIAQMMKVKDRCNTDILSQAAAVAALEDQEYADRTWKHVREERARLTLELQLFGFDVAPSQANFVLARHADQEAAQLYEGLRKQGVLVHHWSGEGMADSLRITVGASQENNALLGALESLLEKSGGQSKADTSVP